MWQDKVRCWVFPILFAGLTYTVIYGMHIVPDQCIELCMCQPVLNNYGMSASEKKSYRICGSDGVTYENICKLMCANCENNITLETRYFNASEIRFAYKICKRATETPKVWKKLFRAKKKTSPTFLPTTTEITTTKKPKQTKLTKPYTGPPTSEPTLAPWVCDKEQKAIIKFAEETKDIVHKNITYPMWMLHLGECEKSSTKEKRSSLYPSATRDGDSCEGICSCDSTHKYVCGTNGISYRNKCVMKCNACEKEMAIKVAHHGKCRSHRTEH